MSDELPVTERTRLRRAHQRGTFDRKTIYAILDAQPLCHVACVVDGYPYVVPTLQWREGDTVYWHGSAASRAIRAQAGAEVCLNVTLLDGLVLARSGFHHSANFRSVTLFGRAFMVDDPEEKRLKLARFIDSLYPGRAAILRPDTPQELKATAVLGLKIREGSAKVKDAGPSDPEEDCALPIWAGVIPLRIASGEPVPDPRNPEGVALPQHVRDFRLG